MKLRRGGGRGRGHERPELARTLRAGRAVDRMSETLASKASAEAPRDIVASRPPADCKPVMATQDLSEGSPGAPPSIAARAGARGGSIGMVLLVALALVGAAVGLSAGRPRQRRALYPGAARRRSPWSACSRCSRWRPASCASPARTRAQPDAQGGGRRGRRRHPGHRSARPRDLCQRRLSRPDRRRPTPTTCGRSSGCSSAIPTCRRRSIACSRRRAKAAALQEEVRVAGLKGKAGALAAACACGRSATRGATRS